MVLPKNTNCECRTVIGAVKSAALFLLLLLLFMAPRNSDSFAAALDPQSELPPPLTIDASRSYRDSVDSMGFNTTNGANEEDDPTLPSEIQKAVCTVTAGEVKASAEAVTTKTLKGVCGSEELHLALSALESKLYQELHEIKMLLQRLSPQNNDVSNMPTTKNPLTMPTMPTAATTTSTTTTTPSTNLKFQPIFETTPENSVSNKVVQVPVAANKPQPQPSSATTPQLKSLSSARQKALMSHLREQEVSKFNNTMLADRDFKVFTYYWKLENFTEHIQSGISATVKSPIFTIKGKALNIKAYFQHLHRDLLYLQLAYATATTLQGGGSQRNNIILDMGGLFKEIHQSSDKVLFKHKITILDQNNQRSKDLVSQEFNNLETGFFIPNSALLPGPYVKNNSLLIQIFLYL